MKSITFSGGGEPTLHPYFDGIVSTAVRNGLEIGLYTHGSHLGRRRAELLKEYAAWVYVSLDECDRDSFRQSKGVDRFPQVLEGIRELVAAQGSATIGVGFLLLVSLVLNAWIAAMGSFFGSSLPIPESVLHIATFLFSFLVITFLFAAIYKLLPDVNLEWSDVAVGASVTSLLFSIGKQLIGLYLGKASFASTYGAAGSLVLVLPVGGCSASRGSSRCS